MLNASRLLRRHRFTLTLVLGTALAVVTINAASARAATHTVKVTVSGGHVTDSRDGGRPVTLIAAALDVPEAVFRDAFSGVTPAGNGGPTEAEAEANKAVLLAALAPYGVTNERLDEVSNYYRYRPQDGGLWRHASARATATVVDGKVTSVKLTKAGAGYTSRPTFRIPGFPDVRIGTTVKLGSALLTNGRIGSLTVKE